MGSVQSEEVFSFFGHSFDALADGVEDAIFILTRYRYNYFHNLLRIGLGLAFTLKRIDHFSLLTLPYFQILLTSNYKLLQFSFWFEGQHLNTPTSNTMVHIQKRLGQMQIVNIVLH